MKYEKERIFPTQLLLILVKVLEVYMADFIARPPHLSKKATVKHPILQVRKWKHRAMG